MARFPYLSRNMKFPKGNMWTEFSEIEVYWVIGLDETGNKFCFAFLITIFCSQKLQKRKNFNNNLIKKKSYILYFITKNIK